MRTISYLLVALFVNIQLLSAEKMFVPKTKVEVTLQCTDATPDILKMNESAKIIETRLLNFGISKYKVSVAKNGTNINITFENNDDFLKIKDILTTNGSIEFYETYNRKEQINKLAFEDRLFSILNIPAMVNPNNIVNSEAIIGYCKNVNKPKVDDYITKSYARDSNLIFNYKWGKTATEETLWLLYLLKHTPVINQNYINKTVVTSFNDSLKQSTIQITFNEEGSEKWRTISENNIGKDIAIVIGSFVYSTTKIMSEIIGGECLVTGSYTLNEANQLAILLNNSKLPLNFKIAE